MQMGEAKVEEDRGVAPVEDPIQRLTSVRGNLDCEPGPPQCGYAKDANVVLVIRAENARTAQNPVQK